MLEDDSVLRCSSAGIVGQTFVGQHGCAAAMHTSHLVWLLACGAAIQSFRRRSSLAGAKVFGFSSGCATISAAIALRADSKFSNGTAGEVYK